MATILTILKFFKLTLYPIKLIFSAMIDIAFLELSSFCAPKQFIFPVLKIRTVAFGYFNSFLIALILLDSLFMQEQLSKHKEIVLRFKFVPKSAVLTTLIIFGI